MTEAEWLSGADPAPLLRFAEPRLTDRLRLLFMAGCCRRVWDLLTDHRFRRVVEMAEVVAEGRAANDVLEAAAAVIPPPGFSPAAPPVDERPAPSDWVRGTGHIRGAMGVGPRAGVGVLNFQDLPAWCRHTYYAVAAVASREYLTVADRCEMAAAHHAGDEIADRHPLHDEIRRFREDVQRLHRTADEYRWRGAGRLYDDAHAAATAAERQTAERVGVLTNEIWTAGAVARVERASAERAAQSDLVRCLIGPVFRPVEVNPGWLTSTVQDLVRGIAADRAFDRLPILADALQDAGCDNADVLSHCRDHPVHAAGCWVVETLSPRESEVPRVPATG